MSQLLKYLLYLVLAFFVFRFLNRLMSPKRPTPPNGNSFSGKRNTTDHFDKPKITIEAESVDFEVIEEPKKKNEE